MMKKSLLTLSLGLFMTGLYAEPTQAFFDPWSRRPLSVFDDSFWHAFDRMDTFGSTASVEEGKITLTYDIPGLSSGDVSVEVDHDNMLVIKGGKKEKCDTKEKEKETHYRSSRSFYKSLSLPQDVDRSKITASVKDGVLTVVIPRKSSQKKPNQKIKVH